MKKTAFLLAILSSIAMDAGAQIDRYTSEREMSTPLHSADVHFKDKHVAITVDIKGRKITMDSTKTAVFKILSVDTSSEFSTPDMRTIKYKCVDENGVNRIIVMVLYSDRLKGLMDSAGQCVLNIGAMSFSYELHPIRN
jgi:hypothetical protein